MQIDKIQKINKSSLNRLSYGMYVLGSIQEDKPNAMVANCVMQVTSKNPTVIVSVSKENQSYLNIKKSKSFSISVLSKEAPMNYIYDLGFLSGRDSQKNANLNVIYVDEIPVFIDYAVSYITARVVNIALVGTHALFVGEIISANMLSDLPVMTYQEYVNKKGSTPRTAPTFNVEKLNRTK